MVTSEQGIDQREKLNSHSKIKRVAVACQGGGMHAAFEVGVLTEILGGLRERRFELMGLSGTSAGGLCALMVWYGLAPVSGNIGSATQAITLLNEFWTTSLLSRVSKLC